MPGPEYLPDMYKRLLEDGVFESEGSAKNNPAKLTADPFYDPYDDPGFDEDQFLSDESKEPFVQTAADFLTPILEFVDPSEGRNGAEAVCTEDKLVIPDPLLGFAMRSHLSPARMPLAVIYEGISFDRQADQETLAADTYRNPLLADVCLGVAPWNRAVSETSGVQTEPAEEQQQGFHLIAFRTAMNYEMSGLSFDDPVKDRLLGLYNRIPDRPTDILFEGKLLPDMAEDGKAVFVPKPLHVPRGVEDLERFTLEQKAAAARYLRNPAPGAPSLVSRLLDPRCSRLVIS